MYISIVLIIALKSSAENRSSSRTAAQSAQSSKMARPPLNTNVNNAQSSVPPTTETKAERSAKIERMLQDLDRDITAAELQCGQLKDQPHPSSQASRAVISSSSQVLTDVHTTDDDTYDPKAPLLKTAGATTALYDVDNRLAQASDLGLGRVTYTHSGDQTIGIDDNIHGGSIEFVPYFSGRTGTIEAGPIQGGSVTYIGVGGIGDVDLSYKVVLGYQLVDSVL